MKSNELLKRLRRYGSFLKREGSAHSLWINPNTGKIEAVPRHTEYRIDSQSKMSRSINSGSKITASQTMT
jgi:mRNA interferase HicA